VAKSPKKTGKKPAELLVRSKKPGCPHTIITFPLRSMEAGMVLLWD